MLYISSYEFVVLQNESLFDGVIRKVVYVLVLFLVGCFLFFSGSKSPSIQSIEICSTVTLRFVLEFWDILYSNY